MADLLRKSTQYGFSYFIALLFFTRDLKIIKKQAIVEKNNKQSWEYKSGYEYTEEFLYSKNC